VNEWYTKLRGYGFHVCTYGNLFEFGWNVQPLNSTLLVCNSTDISQQISCDANTLLRSNFSNNILKDYETQDLIYGGVGGDSKFRKNNSIFQDLLYWIQLELIEIIWLT
jgi:hypothetical protein